MGFDAYLEVSIMFKGGKPYFYDRSGNMEFDLSKIPVIPEEFQCFEVLRGWSWGALLAVEGDKVNVDLSSFTPSFEKMKADPTYREGDISQETFEHFEAFCRWVCDTGIEYRYTMSY